MYYFITDETNVTPSKASEFFIYGGLVLSDEQLSKLNIEITAIRDRYAFATSDSLKFDTNSRPEHVSSESHANAKNDVIEACYQAGAKFIVYLIHHKIAQGDATNTAEFALNSVLSAFNSKFLAEKNADGIVIMDRLPDGKAYAMLRSKFQDGLTLVSGTNYKVDRVVLYATTCNGASHISSAVDIVLGGFRWVVNSASKPSPGTTQRRIFQNVAKMIYGKQVGDDLRVRDYGLILRPETIKSAAYQEQYDNLVAYFVSLLEEDSEAA
jgi:hypothetical protein